MMESIVLEAYDQAAALVALAVIEIERIFPTRPVGRSLLQKIFHILTREGRGGASFDLFMKENGASAFSGL